MDPVVKETYAAMIGQGATLNGDPIKTSGADELGEALFVFSFGRGCKRDDPQVIRFLNILEEVSSVRRLGGFKFVLRRLRPYRCLLGNDA